MTNKIKLNILKIEFESDRFTFRDDGFVKDIHEHSRKLYGEFGDNPAQYDKDVIFFEGKLPIASGKHMVKWNMSPSPIIIFYLRFEHSLKQLFVRAHEETRALDYTENLALLQKAIYDIKLKIDLNSYGEYLDEYSEAELIADIGGLYALIKHGFDSKEIISFLDNEKRYGVLRIYQKLLESESAQL